jgi:hypothetical protein
MKHTPPENRTFSPVPAHGFFKLFGFIVPEYSNCIVQDPIQRIKSLDDYLKIGPVAVSRNSRAHGNQEKFGIYSDHAYGVLDINIKENTVTLFNPLLKEPGFMGFFGYGDKAKCFTLSWPEFLRCRFSTVFSPKNDGYSNTHSDLSSYSDTEDDF